jgi:hypothetical protein
MAVMSATERARCRAQYMREQTTSPGISKVDLAAALAAVDQWIEDNSAAFNAALPLPFRTAANAAEKTVLFCYVAMRRAGRLHAEEDG